MNKSESKEAQAKEAQAKELWVYMGNSPESFCPSAPNRGHQFVSGWIESEYCMNGCGLFMRST